MSSFGMGQKCHWTWARMIGVSVCTVYCPRSLDCGLWSLTQHRLWSRPPPPCPLCQDFSGFRLIKKMNCFRNKGNKLQLLSYWVLLTGQIHRQIISIFLNPALHDNDWLTLVTPYEQKLWLPCCSILSQSYLSYLLTRDQTMAMEFKWDRPQVPGRALNCEPGGFLLPFSCKKCGRVPSEPHQTDYTLHYKTISLTQ